MAEDVQLLARAGVLSQSMLAEGSMRRFAFSVDLRRFQASSRLPLSLAAVVLELALPTELAGLIQQSNGRLPPRLSPLRTPAVQVARSSEVALPGGQAACEFNAGLMSVATLLARSLVMTIDVFHQERLTDNLLLGRAHVPLAPLLQESWVDGQAGVFALAPCVHDPSQHERVQVGTVHLVMALEEVGPAAPAHVPIPMSAAAQVALAPPAPAAGVPAPVSAMPIAGAVGAGAGAAGAVQQHQHRPASAAAAGRGSEPAVPAGAVQPQLMPQQLAADAAQQQQQLVGQPPATNTAAAAVAAGTASAACMASPEFEAAWELELWKKEEETRWRQELRERETKRMAALEEAWRSREQERTAEATALRANYAALDGKARQVLAAAEERERKLVAAEESMARQRRELEREHAGRVAEAEAAVRRLQAECQHQLELEKQRREQAQQAAVAAEARAAAAEARAAAAERALQQHREQYSASEAGRQGRELEAAREALAAAEQRVARAAEGKRKYKEQVVRLAREVALLQQQLAEVVGLRRGQLDAELAQLAAEEAAVAARRDAAEMGALKRQLASLQAGYSSSGSGGCHGAGGSSGDAVSGSGRAAPADGSCSCSNKENSNCGGGSGAHSGGGGGGAAGAPVLRGQLSEAVQRLLKERELLLGSGAYSPGEPLIQELDARIRECAALAQAS